jgi:hypothetical protein
VGFFLLLFWIRAGIGGLGLGRFEREREGREGRLTCRTSLLICPTLTRKFKAAIHSFVLSLVSRAKSCRCVTSLSMTYFSRSLGPWEFMLMVFSVMLSMLRSFIGGTFTCERSILGNVF